MTAQKLQEELFVAFLFFWVTILFLRTFFFFTTHNQTLMPLLVIGELFLLFASLYILIRKQLPLLILLLTGAGAALTINHIISLLTFNFSSSTYWGFGNLFLLLFLGLLPLFYSLFFKSSEAIFENIKKEAHKNPQNPKISVVIPAYNEEKFIERPLASLVKQTFQDFEIIVVDNNCKDKTVEIAKSWGARIVTEKTPGIAHARQTGFMSAKGEIVTTLDSDTILPPDWLEKIANAFEKDSRLVGYGGTTVLYSGPLDARVGIRYFLYPFYLISKIFSGTWSLIGSNMAVKKQEFVKVGGFNTALQQGEDIDISQKLSRLGKVILDPQVVAFISGRRYKNGMLSGLISYGLDFPLKVLFKIDTNKPLAAIRQENYIANKILFLPLFLSYIYLAILFYLRAR